MFEILQSLKLIIERFIAKIVPLLQDVNEGDTIIFMATTRRFGLGEEIVIYNDANMEGSSRTIVNILDFNQIEIDSPMDFHIPASTGKVQKLMGLNIATEPNNAQFLSAVYIGEPDVIMQYPAITINAKSRSSEWLTLESTKETYDIAISVYVQAADYETQYELMHAYTRAIEKSLFRSFYPLVKPYYSTVLAEAITPGDSLIKIVDENLLQCMAGWVWFESLHYLRHNRVIESLGQGVYRLAFPMDRPFDVGDAVIRPQRHIFNSIPRGTQYGTVNKDSMLKASVISWTCDEEVLRSNPFPDPLTF